MGVLYMSENPVRCFGYVRLSTAAQVKGESLDAQKEKVRKRAEYGEGGAPWELLQTMEDAGRSGRKAENRPGLQELLARLGEVDKVIIPRLDRLGRSATDLFEIYKQLD